ncbi:MAG: hypothetical protein ISR65_17685 [Bacteriovoracaceae bacterium]|nr:hypothetical protein [Bacteriovoracaceae bacterium]
MLSDEFFAETQEHYDQLFDSVMENARLFGVEVTDEYQNMVHAYLTETMDRRLLAAMENLRKIGSR